jgi:DNA-binding GntR family transcriptional regulator
MTTMDNITTQGERLRLLSILTPLRYKDAIEEHQEIIKAIENGDKAKVKECIEDHLERTINNYLKITKDNSWDHVIISFKKAFSKI